MDVRTGFSDRTIFLTGGTGFVGKVCLFKILKEFPDFRTVYLLMRGKKSRRFKRYLNAQERLELEVLGSPCFEPVRSAVGEARWKELCGKVKAMNGDIMEDHIGLSEKDRATFSAEVQMIIHMAATVNFNERLDLSIQMNTLGGLRILSLAKTCRALEAMVHVSTCYVNYSRQGKDNVSEEKIYPTEGIEDPEAICKAILAIHPSEVEAESKRLLKRHKFANTYTFTKNLGEKLLIKYKADVPLSIVRPSIIGCSYAEPFPGWVDALTAAGGLLLTGSLGVIRDFLARQEMVADIIPVDFVVNTILKALFVRQQYNLRTAPPWRQQHQAALPTGQRDAAIVPAAVPVQASATNKGSAAALAAAASLAPSTNTQQSAAKHVPTAVAEVLPDTDGVSAEDGMPTAPPLIYQACTSGTENRVTWGRVCDALTAYMQSSKPHPKALGPCEVTITASRAYYLLRYNALRVAPYLVMRYLVKLPEPIGSAKQRALVEKWGMALRRADILNTEFHDFVVTEWYFKNKNTRDLDGFLDPRSQKVLAFDPYAIHWYTYTQMYTYGIFKQIVREVGDLQQPVMPTSAADVFARASSL